MKDRIKNPACGYLRMSTDEQDTSIPIQRKRLLELAEREGYDIIQWYADEGKSGSRQTEKRTEWLRLLQDAPTAKWQTVLCLNVSRFSRLDTFEGAQAKQSLRQQGKRLHTQIEGLLDWNTSTGRIIDTVHSEAANDYAVKVGYSTLEGRLNRFLDKQAYGFKCPYGLARKIADDMGRMRIVSRKQKFTKPRGWQETYVRGDEEEVRIVQWLYEQFDTKDVGYRWLANELNVRKVPSPCVGVELKDDSRFNASGLWCAEVVKRILRNEKYVGDSRFGIRGVGKFWRVQGKEVVKNEYGKGLERNEGVILTDIYDEPIIERERWERVQRKMDNRKRMATKGGREGGYALKGILFCGNCGKPLYGLKQRGEKKSGQVTYTCRKGMNQGSHLGCPQWSIRESAVMPILTEKLVNEIDRKLLEAGALRPPVARKENSEEAALQQRLDAVNRRIDNGAERFLEAPPELTKELGDKLQAWKKERDTTQAELAEATKNASGTNREQEWHKHLAEIKDTLVKVKLPVFIGNAKSIYHKPIDFTPEAFRNMLASADCRVTVWWKKRTENRYSVAKIRVQLSAQNHMTESEMV